MNSIPLTFNEHQINRAVLGGKKVHSESALNISVILLHSTATHFKVNIFENLLGCNFDEIISIEKNPENFALEDISKRFPEIKFLIPQQESTDGELINLAMDELRAEYVLVLRDNLYIPSNLINQHLAEKITSSGAYCIVPRLTDSKKNGITNRYAPTVQKRSFVLKASSLIQDGMKTIYPFDYIAFYNRKKFIQLGGFDYTIESPYYQNLDLGLRSWLWGEETRISSILQLSYYDEAPVEDHTVNLFYIRYYLKNQLPKIKMGAAVIKKRNFLNFFLHSSCGFLEARRQFASAKEWVNINKYRFKMDLPAFVEYWDSEIDKTEKTTLET